MTAAKGNRETILRRRDPDGLQRCQHALWRRHLHGQRLSGLEQTLEAGEDRGPALPAAFEDIVAERAVMRLDHCQPHRVAGLLDLVSDEGRPELLEQPWPVDVEGDGEPLQWLAFDH